jgi:hypothetical protein
MTPENSISLPAIGTLLQQYKGRAAIVNQKDSEHFGWLVLDVFPLKEPGKSISIIEDITSELLILNYFDAQEMHYIPLEKIIKVNVIMRER